MDPKLSLRRENIFEQEEIMPLPSDQSLPTFPLNQSPEDQSLPSLPTNQSSLPSNQPSLPSFQSNH